MFTARRRLSWLLVLLFAAWRRGGRRRGDAASRGHRCRHAPLSDTFSGNKDVKSGKLDLALRRRRRRAAERRQRARSRVKHRAARSRAEGKKKLPKFDIDFALRGRRPEHQGRADLDRATRASSTSRAPSYVRLRPGLPAVQGRLRAGPEAGQRKQDQQSLSSLGLDPRAVADEPEERGRGRRSATTTRSRSPAASTSTSCSTTSTQALPEDARSSASRAPQQPARRQLTDAQKKQVVDAVKDPTVEIYTGKEDKILRRMVHRARRSSTRRAPRGSANIKLRPLDLRPQRGPGGLRALRRQAVRPAALAARRARPRWPGRPGGSARCQRLGGGSRLGQQREPREVLEVRGGQPATMLTEARECQKLLTGGRRQARQLAA